MRIYLSEAEREALARTSGEILASEMDGWTEDEAAALIRGHGKLTRATSPPGR